MSPELRVCVPDKKEASFRKAVGSVDGAHILSRIPSPKERERLDKEVKEEFQKLIATLREPKTRKIQKKVNSGYHRLIKDIQRESTLTRPLETRELKKILVDIFPRLRMSRTIAIVHRYGLIDGEFRTYKEAGRLMGLSATQTRNLVLDGQRRMYRPLGQAGLGLLKSF